ncbi:hypothetical protein HWV62_30463 [Athelia sp. TMB]|nr:hypothetical protein HWV62_30463 [Athelia sp. TMB]
MSAVFRTFNELMRLLHIRIGECLVEGGKVAPVPDAVKRLQTIADEEDLNALSHILAILPPQRGAYRWTPNAPWWDMRPRAVFPVASYDDHCKANLRTRIRLEELVKECERVDLELIADEKAYEASALQADTLKAGLAVARGYRPDPTMSAEGKGKRHIS